MRDLSKQNQELKELVNGIREERDYLFNKLTFENQQLQNQVEKLTRENNDLEERVIHQDNVIKQLQEHLKAERKDGNEVQDRIDEAIEYIRDCCNMDSKWVNLHYDYAQNEMSSDQVDELLEILRSKE